MISVRSVHNHEAIQMGDLLQPGALPPRSSSMAATEHASTHHTIRSVKELFQEFEEQNMEAIELAWKDLTVMNPDGSKTLLTGASGKVHGSFLAIMGPSGSGKTTMMNVLACRSGGMQSDGTKVINGTNYSLSELKSISGYVMQVKIAPSVFNLSLFRTICSMESSRSRKPSTTLLSFACLRP
jgi:ABC-type transport system involved in cytochrome bd biosynthesis fused ATPase/permease subunit